MAWFCRSSIKRLRAARLEVDGLRRQTATVKTILTVTDKSDDYPQANTKPKFTAAETDILLRLRAADGVPIPAAEVKSKSGLTKLDVIAAAENLLAQGLLDGGGWPSAYDLTPYGRQVVTKHWPLVRRP